ncbi:MAG: ATP-binding protein, partial [Legionella sp.]|nr:ATP-binding protein [Legionella sp.]
MYNRLLKINPDSKHSVFLFGPRGTGKTSWLRSHFKNALYYDLLDDNTYTRLLAFPTRIADDVPHDFNDWIIIDEIQKAPKLLDEVHRLIEHRQLRFILTGSSARQLRQKGVNLLAGRAVTCHMHPLTSLELGDDFNLNTALTYGLLPSVYSHENPGHYLASYVATYLREEVLQEGITRNIALFTRFLETASFSQGEQVNFTEIAREVGNSRHTIANFFDILEDLLIAYRAAILILNLSLRTLAFKQKI